MPKKGQCICYCKSGATDIKKGLGVCSGQGFPDSLRDRIHGTRFSSRDSS